jgi:hypothetical protein
MGALTIGCIIAANSINLNRNAALAGAYSLAEVTMKEYQAKVVEKLGENKEREIRDDISRDRVENNPLSRNEVIYTTHGDTLFYDPYSGRYFKSDIEYVKQVLNKLSRDMLTDGENICLNDVYYELDLKRIDLGNHMGWSANDGIIEADFYAAKAEDEQPCLVLNYKIEPRYQYGRINN